MTINNKENKNYFLEYKPNVNYNGRSVREIFTRNVLLSILFSFLASLIFMFFWMYEIDKETKSITSVKKGAKSFLVIIFSFLTLGIYTYYWAYQVGKKQSKGFSAYGQDKSKLNLLYLIILITGFICYMAVESIIINYFSIFGHNPHLFLYQKTISYFSVFFYFVGILIVFSLMQINNNKLIKMSCTKYYCTDDSIFNKPILSTILLIILGTSVPDLVKTFMQNIFYGKQFTNVKSIDIAIEQVKNEVARASSIEEIIINLSVILTTILLLWWFSMRFKHLNYHGVLNKKNLFNALLLLIPATILALLNLLSCIEEGSINVNIGLLIYGCIPGFTEEIAFRGMIIPNFMRIKPAKSTIYISLVASSLIFGLIHIGNVFVGANFETTLFQVFYATGLGFIFAAVLLRTGNLWGSIICHAFIDTCAFLAPSALEQGAVQTQSFVWDIGSIFIICLTLFFIAYSFWLVRPKKHIVIIKLWQEMFNYK